MPSKLSAVYLLSIPFEYRTQEYAPRAIFLRTLEGKCFNKGLIVLFACVRFTIKKKLLYWLPISTLKMAIPEEELPIPKPVKRISSHEILMGKFIQPLDRLRTFSEDEYEDIVLYWASGYLSQRYQKVRRLGGSGDKGRDIVCYTDDSSFDIYQCKYYATKIAPTNIYVELGKLCYYTFRREYAIPRQYYIVSPQGIGTGLFDLLDNSEQLRQALIDNWDKYCSNKITQKATVTLNGDFNTYVNNFDFSIIKDIAPHEFIAQFEQTKYYASWFGGGLKKFRQSLPVASSLIEDRELPYVGQLLKVYSEKLDRTVRTADELAAADSTLNDHFHLQRKSFFCAESLEQFSRDNFPDANPMPFDELKDDTFSLVNDVLLLHENDSGMERLLRSTMKAKEYPFTNNPLHGELKPHDKEGICHHLANENKVQWMKKT